MENLNTNQQKVLNHAGGPLLIIAGAGTGKTTTIVAKILDLINKNICKPEEIACLTFTEKASQEMEDRIDKGLPYGVFGTNVTTFHKFADDILKNEAIHIGLNPNYKLMNESQQIYFLKKHILDIPLNKLTPPGRPYSCIEDILKHFSRLQDEDVDTDSYLKWSNNNKCKIQTPDSEDAYDAELYEELSLVYQKYQELKIEKNVMDFGDLTFNLLKLFKTMPSILKEYQKKYPYIFVDEFQDTNFSQYEVLKTLCPANLNPNIIVVGDDSQGIYKFRGATVSNILNFINDYPLASQVILNDNYRSSQPILDFAYRVVKNNDPDTLEFKLGISKVLKSHREPEESPVTSMLFQNDQQEASWIAKKIKDLYEKSNIALSEIAILTRAKDHQEIIVQNLRLQGIPFKSKGSNNLLMQSDVRNLISYLRVLSNTNESQALYKILSLNFFKLHQKDVVSLNSLAKAISFSLFQTLELLIGDLKTEDVHIKLKDELKKYIFSEDSLTKFKKIHELLLKNMNDTRDQKVVQVLLNFLNESGYMGFLMNNETAENVVRVQNIAKFFNFLNNLSDELLENNINELLDYIAIVESKDDLTLNPDIETEQLGGVSVMTVHASKGLEFAVVFMPSLSELRFPSISKSEKFKIPAELIKDTLPQGDEHIQEERRLFYVGSTRAKNQLFLTSSEIYGTGTRKRKVSRFVLEGLGVTSQINQIITTDKSDQLSIFESPKTNIVSEILNNQEIVLSFSKINDYEICPLKYKYKYILNIPTKLSPSLSIGSVVHKVLQKFYSMYKINRNVSKDTLLNLLENYWNPVGYESQKHELSSKNSVKKLLEDFYENFHTGDSEVLELEKSFKIKIASDVTIVGKIDRIDKLKNDSLEIIDYKIGESKNKSFKKDDQLAVYAMAVSNKSLYDKPLSKISLSYYFLKDKKKITLSQSEETVEEITNKISDIAKKIKKGDFKANVGYHCKMCEFNNICEAYQKNSN